MRGWRPEKEACRQRATSRRASRAQFGQHHSRALRSPPIVFELRSNITVSALCLSFFPPSSSSFQSGGDGCSHTRQLLAVLKVLVAESIRADKGTSLGITDVLVGKSQESDC